MHPFERLRYLARHVGDDRALVAEAAECLAAFDDDPAQLVLVCRRLLAHHPRCGPLWWLCARVVGAPRPSAAVEEAMRVVARDRTADRLASVLPFPHDEPIAVLGWPEPIAAALEQRPDLDVAIVCPDGIDAPTRRRLARTTRAVRTSDPAEAVALGCTHLLIEPWAAGPTTALVPPGAADLRVAVGGAECWLVVTVDRLLPERLFAVLGEHRDDAGELMALSDATRLAGPGGLDTPERLATRIDCPVAPELLRL